MAPSRQGYICKIKQQIEDGLVTSVSEHLFLPTDKLHEILTLEAIQLAVIELDCGPEHRIKLTETIHNEGKRVFAMLIYNDWQNYIIKFREHDALDNQLPLSESDAVMIAEEIGRRLARESQWTFCPYTFPKDMSARDCHVEKKMILPLISVEQIGSGAFSIVEKVSISPSQQNFIDEKAEVVQAVRKKLNTKGNIQDYNREVRCLRLLNQLQHPNIIPLWGAYTYQGENNFLFPYIGMDLGRFLLSQERHQDFQWDFTFYSALAGLASALSKTHCLRLDQAKHDVDFEAIGYHHDLRPPNVLVCADNFILADFGMGCLKGMDELSHTPYKPISGDYIAPECTDMQETPQIINRKIDVWAFGCLMAEVITFILKGADGVQEFRSRRLTPGRFPQWKDASFYQPHGAVKQEVIDWMEALRCEHPNRDLVQLIKISFDALNPDPQSRPDISTVHQRLADVSMKTHLQTVRDMFREVQGAEPVSTSLTQHHLESLQLECKRFEVWANVLTSGEDRVSTQTYELSDSRVRIMKSLLHALREELQKRISRDSSGQASVSRRIAREVENLWKSLQGNLLQLAKKQWEDDPGNRRLGERISDLRHVTHHDVVAALSALPADTLRSEFEEEARSFKDGLPESMPFSGISEITSIENFYDITVKIQADQHRSGGGLRNLAKLKLYLVRLEGYANAINSTVQGNSEVLAVLWGPIAFLLQLAVTLDEAYDSLVGAVAELGRVLPDFKAADSTSNHDMETMEVMVLFFKDILNFYRELIQPFTHQNWMHVFDRLWAKHYNNLLEAASHIERLTRLMRREIHLEHIQQEYEFRKHAMAGFKAQKREAQIQEFHRIYTSINPCRYDNTLYRLKPLRCQGTGDWLFQSQKFLDWVKDSQREGRKVLWLKGIPGAGKTVLSSVIVEYLKRLNGARIAFAFLTYQEVKTSALSTIHSLIFQLVGRNDDLMAIVCESMSDHLMSDLSAGADLLVSLIHYVGPVYLVLDGADEISQIERGRLVAELLRLTEISENLRIIFSTRPEADLIRLLDDTAVVINVHDENEGNIKNYIEQRSAIILRNILDPRAQFVMKQLLEPLAGRAKGMFLYARLIMDMVATLHDLSEIQRELTNLPESLDAAYVSSPHLGPQLIDISQSTMDLAVCCISYLCQRRYDSDLTEVDICQLVCTGQYVFHAFSTRMWFELVCQYLLATKTGYASHELINFIQMLWKARKTQDSSNTDEDNIISESDAESESESDAESESDPSFESLKTQQPQVYQILSMVSRFRRQSFMYTGNENQDLQKNRDDPISISDTSRRIRQAFDNILCKDPTYWNNKPCHEHCADILRYYGPRPFKCKFPQCEFWHHGFQRRAIRDKHELSHDTPLKCHISGCEYEVIGFLSERMRKDHVNNAHRTGSLHLSFGVPNLDQYGVGPILLDLIKKDEVETVQQILSAVPVVFQGYATRDTLLTTAAFQASGSMLKLLTESKGLSGWNWAACTKQSIIGRNISSLSFLLFGGFRPPSGDSSAVDWSPPFPQLVSSDWHDGTKQFARWIQSNGGVNIKWKDTAWRLLNKRIIRKAASHQNGNQQLLYLWEESGISQFVDTGMANYSLKHVARYSYCPHMATYLLRLGANVNHCVSVAQPTALQYAARKSSAEAAKMVRFLLLNGADPEVKQTKYSGRGRSEVRKVSEEEGAKGIYKWLGITWDALVEETKRHRETREASRVSISKIGE
ncbi:hypothetical protein NUW58_g234 [Xylaria curta]|uniref:Uncharacterized protein n=1 Tax=Xylaria curta TaxID=42375 RepID=A0ACC1PR43_9PEZI|nr:hypothetical protein NUW58_g234 [Xylaria curta]